MPELIEGSLKLALPKGVHGEKFDGKQHRFSHGMKAVDFLIEGEKKVWFIECKSSREAFLKEKKCFLKKFGSGKLNTEFIYKYRDSFLYWWAQKRFIEKTFYFAVIIGMKLVDEALLLNAMDNLSRRLPSQENAPRKWKRFFVYNCGIFSISSWNRNFPKYLIFFIN